MPESRIIFATRRTFLTDASIECDPMPIKVTLQTYLKQVLKDEGLSLGDVARNSKSGDSGISKDYVSGLVLGEHTNPTPEKIIALARGIRRPLDEVLDVIFGKVRKDETVYRDTTIRTLLAEFNELPANEQKELKPSLDMFLREIRRRKSNR